MLRQQLINEALEKSRTWNALADTEKDNLDDLKMTKMQVQMILVASYVDDDDEDYDYE